MKIFGLTIQRAEAAVPQEGELVEKQAPARIIPQMQGWVSSIWEPFAGAWQRNITPKGRQSILAFSAVYACISLIAGDMSKLRQMLMLRLANGIWQEVEAENTHGNAKADSFLAILRKPNAFQTRIQFLSNWITSKLIHGNAYILKERLNRVVVALYVLDPCNVTPLVTDEGEVFYQLQSDYLSGVDESTIVPASEIIHDRMVTFWHPLIGVSPIFACGQAALQGLAIQGNSENFFKNMSIPSGVISTPGKISPETAKRIKDNWQEGFSGLKLGRVAILGDGLVYKQMTIPASDAQLIEQLGWTVGDVARCFHVPPYKLGLQTNVTFSNAGQLNQDYYSQCLQVLIEEAEVLMDEGLELPPQYRTEFDLEGLLRMDPLGQAETNQKAITSGILAPNEARRARNLPPVKGGDTPYLQEQNAALSALAARDALPPKSAVPALAPPSEPAAAPPSTRDIADAVLLALLPALEQKRAKDQAAEDEAADFARKLIALAAAA